MLNEQDVASLNAPRDDNPNGPTSVIIQSSEKQFTETSPSVRGKTDPAWEHFAYKKDGRTIVYTCLHCGSNFKGGGINRMKHHLAGIPGQISSCKKVSHDIRQRMQELLKDIQKRKKSEDLNGAYDDQFIKEEVQEVHPYPSVGKMQLITPNKEKSKVNKIDSYFTPRTTPGFQPSLKTELSNEEALHKAKMAIARWFFDASIPSSAVQSPYFQDALDAITAIGRGFKVPSYNELRVNLLGDCKKECQLLIEGYRENWAKSGCTILVDGWSDQRQRTLINFLVYCPTGMAFVKSVDASDIVKDAMTLCNMLSEVIEWVGAENVVHIVTDNAANYVAAGSLIHEKYETIFWSPCAAQCVNLVLKDIANMSHVADVASKASKITVFVYNQMTLLSWLRKRKGWKEIVHTEATQFANTFITLKNIYDCKYDLEALVVDKHFTSSRLAKTETGEAVSAIILDSKFWNDCFMIAKLVAPIIRLQRIFDREEKPSLGYVYEGMQRAKNVIKEMSGNTRLFYKPYTNIIKTRWDKHLTHGLHAAAYFLNPAFFYDENFSEKNRVTQALLDLFEMKAFCNDVSKAIQELQLYRDRQGSFSRESALTSRKKVKPDEWWRLYGGSAPILQKLAIRLLCQTSSSLKCEKNWNVFERIHAKKRNRLEHQRLNDLIYVTYNLRLKKRWHHRKTCHDPIDYEIADKVEFWVTEEASPELDIDEIENFIYDESAIPIGESSKNNEGDEDLDTTKFQFGIGDGSSGEDVFNIFEYKGINLDECYGDW